MYLHSLYNILYIYMRVYAYIHVVCMYSLYSLIVCNNSLLHCWIPPNWSVVITDHLTVIHSFCTKWITLGHLDVWVFSFCTNVSLSFLFSFSFNYLLLIWKQREDVRIWILQATEHPIVNYLLNTYCWYLYATEWCLKLNIIWNNKKTKSSSSLWIGEIQTLKSRFKVKKNTFEYLGHQISSDKINLMSGPSDNVLSVTWSK